METSIFHSKMQVQMLERDKMETCIFHNKMHMLESNKMQMIKAYYVQEVLDNVPFTPFSICFSDSAHHRELLEGT